MAANGVPVAAAAAAAKPSWLHQVEYAKRKERSDIKLSEWQVGGFATRRAADVEAACTRLVGSVRRLKASELTYEQFAEFEKGKECVLIDGVPQAEGWGVRDWTFEGLGKSFGNERFKVGKADDGTALKLNLKDYFRYLETQQDDSPLYVFDSVLGGPTVRPHLVASFKVPSYFPDDFMSLIDDRPPHRWVLAGPRRSGTCCHVDPLATSAWNTLLVGRKKWALIPPEVPRGIAKGKTVLKRGEDDEAVNFFVDLIPRLRKAGVQVTEVVQEEGETIFVPSNWWHCVMNITDTVAVTQNYCGRHNFDEVWRSARTERPCMAPKWLANMEAKAPAWAARARELNAADGFDMTALPAVHAVRRADRRTRRKTRALARAKEGKAPLDEVEWEARYHKEHPYDSDSTVSSTSSGSDSDSSSDSDSDSDSESTDSS